MSGRRHACNDGILVKDIYILRYIYSGIYIVYCTEHNIFISFFDALVSQSVRLSVGRLVSLL